MKTLLIALLLATTHSYAVDGLTIPNAYQVDPEGNIFRGREPKKAQLTELAHIGITDVIIFKNDVKGEVEKEKAELAVLGLNAHHIPFKWKEYPSMQVACEQIVEAINVIKQVKRANGKVFFHCTAGEDRTGTLAGLYRMLEEKISTKDAFANEMCARHFSDGNFKKPKVVTEAIEKELTPLFVALSQKIEKGEWKFTSIPKSTCKNLQVVPTTLKCRK